MNADAAPAKRRSITEPNCDENVAIPSSSVSIAEKSVENKLLRVRSITDLQKYSSSLVPVNTANSTNANQMQESTEMSKFVPKHVRYRCFVHSCEFRGVSSDMLQQHIQTSHGQATHLFRCPHCGKLLNGFSDAKHVLNHLRFHGSRIYKCPSCSFAHYCKKRVNNHLSSAHTNVRDRAKKMKIKLRKSGFLKWSCNDCSVGWIVFFPETE